MKLLFRLLYSSIIAGWVLLMSHIEMWDRGYELGYKTAMADVVIGVDTPENYLTKMLDKQSKKRLEQKQEDQ